MINSNELVNLLKYVESSIEGKPGLEINTQLIEEIKYVLDTVSDSQQFPALQSLQDKLIKCESENKELRVLNDDLEKKNDFYLKETKELKDKLEKKEELFNKINLIQAANTDSLNVKVEESELHNKDLSNQNEFLNYRLTQNEESLKRIINEKNELNSKIKKLSIQYDVLKAKADDDYIFFKRQIEDKENMINLQKDITEKTIKEKEDLLKKIRQIKENEKPIELKLKKLKKELFLAKQSINKLTHKKICQERDDNLLLSLLTSKIDPKYINDNSARDILTSFNKQELINNLPTIELISPSKVSTHDKLENLQNYESVLGNSYLYDKEDLNQFLTINDKNDKLNSNIKESIHMEELIDELNFICIKDRVERTEIKRVLDILNIMNEEDKLNKQINIEEERLMMIESFLNEKCNEDIRNFFNSSINVLLNQIKVLSIRNNSFEWKIEQKDNKIKELNLSMSKLIKSLEKKSKLNQSFIKERENELLTLHKLIFEP